MTQNISTEAFFQSTFLKQGSSQEQLEKQTKVLKGIFLKNLEAQFQQYEGSEWTQTLKKTLEGSFDAELSNYKAQKIAFDQIIPNFNQRLEQQFQTISKTWGEEVFNLDSIKKIADQVISQTFCNEDLMLEDSNFKISLFHLSIQKGWETQFKNLLTQVDLNAIDAEGNTALHHAYKCEQFFMASLLEEKGVDSSRPNNAGESIKYLQLVTRIKSTLFKTLDTQSPDFKILIQKYGEEAVLKVVDQIYRETLRSVRSPIANPLALLTQALKMGHPFLGRPIIASFDSKTNLRLPEITWPAAHLSNHLIDGGDGIDFINPLDKKLWENMPSDNLFQNEQELQQALDYFKETLPTTCKYSGCYERADWIAVVLSKIMKYRVNIIKAVPASGRSLSVKSPYDSSFSWQSHAVPVVFLSDQTAWILDVLLPSPIRFEDWVKVLEQKEKDLDVFILQSHAQVLPKMEDAKVKMRGIYLMELSEKEYKPDSWKRWVGLGLAPSISTFRDFSRIT